MEEHSSARLQEIDALFARAEAAIKETETLCGEVVIPAINQLRYAGRHILHALALPSTSPEIQEQLARAKRHCQRAVYDASEAAVLYHLEQLRKFEDRFRGHSISSVWPAYLDDIVTIEEIRQAVTELQRTDADDTDNPNDPRLRYFERIQSHGNQLKPLHMKARRAAELLLAMKRHQVMFNVGITSIGALLGALLTFVLSYPG